MKHELKLVNPTDVVRCLETGVHLNYYFRVSKTDKISDYLKETIEDKRVVCDPPLDKKVKNEKVEKDDSKKEQPVKETKVPEKKEEKVEEPTQKEKPKELKDMDKEELLEHAKENKVKVTAKMTEAKIREAIQKETSKEK